jgi:hypothetical protein
MFFDPKKIKIFKGILKIQLEKKKERKTTRVHTCKYIIHKKNLNNILYKVSQNSRIPNSERCRGSL